jgi:8-oxo-dGTP pyrophosphatase MutT (NUDIX family)
MRSPIGKAGRAAGAAVGQQYAALPWRDQDGLEVLLVTSRETRRWVIPKGWPMKNKKPHAAAAREALEEAGVTGRVLKRPIGAYSYIKRLKNGAPLQCSVDVFPLKVTGQVTRWREQGERTGRWFSIEEAAEAVDEEDLKVLIRRFADHIRADAARKKGKTAAVVSVSAPAGEPRA